MKLLNTMMGRSGLTLADQALVSGLSFGTGIYLAHALGLRVFGQYSLILVISLFCMEIQRNFIIAPMITYHTKQEKAYISHVTLIQLAFSAIIAVLAGGIIYLSRFYASKWEIGAFTFPAIFFIFIRLQQDFIRKKYFAELQAFRALYTDVLAATIILTGLIFVKDLTISYILYLFSTSYILSIIPFYTTPGITNNIMPVTNLHWHFSKWLMASSLATYLSSELMIMIGSSVIGTEAAGIIKSSQYIMGGMIIIFQAMENIIPNYLARLENRYALIEGIYNSLFWVLGCAFLHGIIIFILLDPILKWINHGSYTNLQYHICLGYICFSFLLSINYTLNYLLRALERTKAIFNVSLCTAIISILFSYPLAKFYGVYGLFSGLFLIQIIILGIYLNSVRRAL